jgi:hypothetical protein
MRYMDFVGYVLRPQLPDTPDLDDLIFNEEPLYPISTK